MWNFGRIFLLILGILGLAFYYYFADVTHRQELQERIGSARLLSLAEGEEVTHITIGLTKEGPIQLQLEKQGWQVQSPIHYPAENLLVDGLVAALTTTTAEREFPASEIEISETGLKEPIQKIGVTLKTQIGIQEKILLLGKEVPTGNFIYAMWEGGEKLYLIHQQFARSFDKTVYSLRRKRIFNFMPEMVYAADISLDGKGMTLVKWNQKWQSVTQNSQAVDPGMVDSFLANVTGIYVKEFLDSLNMKNPDLGLFPKKNFITLTDPNGVSTTLWIGNENKEKEGFYALIEGESTVLLVPRAMILEIPRPATVTPVSAFTQTEPNEDIQNKPTVPAPAPAPVALAEDETVDKVELKKLGNQMTLMRNGEDWKFETEQSVSETKLNAAVRDLLKYLESVEFKNSVDESKRPIIPYAITIKLHSPEESSTEYTFYKRGAEIIAQSSVRAGLFQVEPGVWTEVDEYFREILSYRKV